MSLSTLCKRFGHLTLYTLRTELPVTPRSVLSGQAAGLRPSSPARIDYANNEANYCGTVPVDVFHAHLNVTFSRRYNGAGRRSVMTKKKRRQFKVEEKISLLKRHLIDGIPVAALCEPPRCIGGGCVLISDDRMSILKPKPKCGRQSCAV